MENAPRFEEVLGAIVGRHFTSDQLRRLNHTVIEQLKAQRNDEARMVAATLSTGSAVIVDPSANFKGRWSWINGAKGVVQSVNKTRAVVVFPDRGGIDARAGVGVPMQVLSLDTDEDDSATARAKRLAFANGRA